MAFMDDEPEHRSMIPTFCVFFLVLVCFDAFIKSIPAKAQHSDLSGPSGNEAFLIRFQD